jgi:hypothetical protein
MKYVITFLIFFAFPVFAIEPTATTAPQSTEIVQPIAEDAPVLKNLPPVWLESAIEKAESVPVVGPIVVTITKWLGVIAGILTVLVTALLAAIQILSRVLNVAKMTALAARVQAISKSPVIYWLSFFSMYNAKKEEKAAGPTK